MKPATKTVRTVDLELGAGDRTLRVTLTRHADGEPESLVLASGFGGGETGEPFRRPAWDAAPLTLPASALLGLRAALDALDERET